jgi:hypothetical protein
VVIDNLATFLFVSPNLTKFFPLFAWSQLEISAILDSVSAVSEGYQLNYCWILKLLSGPLIFQLLNCVVTNLAACLFVPSVLGENIPTA